MMATTSSQASSMSRLGCLAGSSTQACALTPTRGTWRSLSHWQRSWRTILLRSRTSSSVTSSSWSLIAGMADRGASACAGVMCGWPIHALLSSCDAGRQQTQSISSLIICDPPFPVSQPLSQPRPFLPIYPNGKDRRDNRPALPTLAVRICMCSSMWVYTSSCACICDVGYASMHILTYILPLACLIHPCLAGQLRMWRPQLCISRGVLMGNWTS